MVVGLTLTVLGFVQVFKGMRLYGVAWQRNAPGYVWALYYVSLILLGHGLPYILIAAHRWLRFAYSVDFNRSSGTDSKDGRLLCAHCFSNDIKLTTGQLGRTRSLAWGAILQIHMASRPSIPRARRHCRAFIPLPIQRRPSIPFRSTLTNTGMKWARCLVWLAHRQQTRSTRRRIGDCSISPGTCTSHWTIRSGTIAIQAQHAPFTCLIAIRVQAHHSMNQLQVILAIKCRGDYHPTSPES
jgi:hypothetical protein